MARETVDANGNPTGETVAEQFLWQVLNHAMAAGNPALIREILDRHDGKLPEPPKPAASESVDDRADAILSEAEAEAAAEIERDRR